MDSKANNGKASNSQASRGIHPSDTGLADGLNRSGRPEGVVALNSEAEVFLTLAAQISGAAVGWNSSAIALLLDGLQDQFGELLGTNSDRAAATLVRLATTPIAA